MPNGTTTAVHLLSDARQRTHLALWTGRFSSVGVHWWVSGLLGAAFYHYQHHPPPTFPCQAMCVGEQTLHGGRVCTGRWVWIVGWVGCLVRRWVRELVGPTINTTHQHFIVK